jgi:hypothetical protein
MEKDKSMIILICKDILKYIEGTKMYKIKKYDRFVKKNKTGFNNDTKHVYLIVIYDNENNNMIIRKTLFRQP